MRGRIKFKKKKNERKDNVMKLTGYTNRTQVT